MGLQHNAKLSSNDLNMLTLLIFISIYGIGTVVISVLQMKKTEG